MFARSVRVCFGSIRPRLLLSFFFVDVMLYWSPPTAPGSLASGQAAATRRTSSVVQYFVFHSPSKLAAWATAGVFKSSRVQALLYDGLIMPAQRFFLLFFFLCCPGRLALNGRASERRCYLGGSSLP
jgi:hypothetical protein